MHILRSFTSINPIICIPSNNISAETAEVKQTLTGREPKQVARLDFKLFFLLYSKDLNPGSIGIQEFQHYYFKLLAVK